METFHEREGFFSFIPKHLSLLSGLLTILVLFSLLSWHSSCAGRITWTTCLFQLRHSLWEFRSCPRVTEKLNIKKTLLHKGPHYDAFGCFKHLEHLKVFFVCVCLQTSVEKKMKTVVKIREDKYFAQLRPLKQNTSINTN